MNLEEMRKIAEAYKKVKEKMDPVGQADADINNDGNVDSSDEYLRNRRRAIGKAMNKESSCGKMRKEEKVECPKCKGKGCSHCDDTGYHMKEEVDLEEAKGSIRVDIPYFDDIPERAKKVQRKHRVKVVDKGRDYQITGDKKNIIKFLMDKDSLEWDKDEIEWEFPELFEEVELDEDIRNMPQDKLMFHSDVPHGSYTRSEIHSEIKRRKRTGEYQKVTPKQLHNKRMQAIKKEEVELFSEKEINAMIDAGVFEASRADHYKSATPAETMKDKYKGKAADDMAADHDAHSPKHVDITPEDEGHNDAVKAGKATKQSAPRGGADKLSNGASKTPEKVKKVK